MKRSMPYGRVLIFLLCLPLICTYSSDSTAATIGLYFDLEATDNCVPPPTPYPVVATAYLVAHGRDSDVAGIEGRIDTDGLASVVISTIPSGGANYSQLPNLMIGYSTPIPAGDNMVLAELLVVAMDSCALFLRGAVEGTVPYHDGFVALGEDGDMSPLFCKFGGGSQPVMTIGEYECPQMNENADWSASTLVLVDELQLCLYGHWAPAGYVELRANSQHVYVHDWLVSPRIPLDGFSRRIRRSAEDETLASASRLQRKARGRLDSEQSDERLREFFLASGIVREVLNKNESYIIVSWLSGGEIAFPRQKVSTSRFEQVQEIRTLFGRTEGSCPGSYQMIRDSLEDGLLVIVSSFGDVLIPPQSRDVPFVADAIMEAMGAAGPITDEGWGNDKPFPSWVAEQMRSPLPESFR